MNINEIKNPKFLKKFNINDLEKLSDEIRKYIIEVVSVNGGHLSSNLGVVDLTIAIHKVFNASKDKIIFDVGHQCYTHKILTGRSEKFRTIRKFNGLSGFQSISESEYDAYEAGHSSTSISAALGFAHARDLNKDHYEVISIIGDGSIGNGVAFEALNQIGELKNKVIIILNDNEMSISKNIGSLHNSLDKLRSAKKYKNVKNKTKQIISKIPLIGNAVENLIDNIKDGFKKIYLKEGYLFEEFNLKYYGPINGHDYDELIKYLEISKNENTSVLLHVISEKGKGYKYAENDKVGLWHGVGPFNIETGEFIKKNSDKISWSEVISRNLMRLTETNKDIIAITPAMENGSHLTEYKNKFPDNYIDVGIAEEHSLVFANALALSKKKPFVSIYSTFLQRGYDQLIHDIAKMNKNVVIGIDRCGIVGEDGSSHQGIYDVSFMLPIPNFTIMAPKDSIEAANMMYSAFKYDTPVSIRYSKNYLKYKEKDFSFIKKGKWETIIDGNDATIISYGDFLETSVNISKKLSKNNKLSVEVVNARFIKPIDIALFKKILNKNNPVFVYEESCKIGSLGSYLSMLAQNYEFKNKIYIIGIEDEFVIHGNKNEILKHLKIDEESVYNYIKKVLTKN